jgi:LysR family cyn operon transcriptional activator
MELRHLRYFVAVADAASVSRAALRIHVSQPALSRQIQDLESELGVRLFDRVGRRIQLTTEGEDLLHRSRELLAGAESLAERARVLGGGKVGSLRLGATPQAMQSVVASFLGRYARSWPGVDVRLVEAGGVRLLDLVDGGQLHLALTGVSLRPHLASRLLFPIRVLAIARDRPRWKGRSTMAVEDLASEPLLLLRPEFGARQLFDAACRIAQLEPRVVLEGSEPHALVALAEAGHGVAIVPSTVRVGSKRSRALPIIDQGKSLGTWGGLVWDPRRSLPAYATGFIDQLAAQVQFTFPGRIFERRAPPVPRPRATLPVSSGPG